MAEGLHDHKKIQELAEERMRRTDSSHLQIEALARSPNDRLFDLRDPDDAAAAEMHFGAASVGRCASRAVSLRPQTNFFVRL